MRNEKMKTKQKPNIKNQKPKTLKHKACPQRCDAAAESITQGLAKAIVVVDNRDCAAALALAEWCSSCDVVLCAAWELDGTRSTCHYIYIYIYRNTYIYICIYIHVCV